MSAASLLWIVLLLIITNEGANANFCPGDVPAGRCFDEKLIPMAFATMVIGFVFGIFIVSFGIFLFRKTKMNTPWVHNREPTNWLRDCQDIGADNRLRKYEERNPGFGDKNPKYFVSDQSLYSEGETAFPPSEDSHIMDAFDSLNDERDDYPKTSGYHWAPGQAMRNETQRGEGVPDRIHKPQVFIGENPLANTMDDASPGNDYI